MNPKQCRSVALGIPSIFGRFATTPVVARSTFSLPTAHEIWRPPTYARVNLLFFLRPVKGVGHFFSRGEASPSATISLSPIPQHCPQPARQFPPTPSTGTPRNAPKRFACIQAVLSFRLPLGQGLYQTKILQRARSCKHGCPP